MRGPDGKDDTYIVLLRLAWRPEPTDRRTARQISKLFSPRDGAPMNGRTDVYTENVTLTPTPTTPEPGSLRC